MLKRIIGIGVATLTLLWLPLTGWAQEPEIVAHLDRIQGRVNVRQAATEQMVQGRDGLLLRIGDLVTTETEARATIQFRDGSEIRLFSDTSFLIESAKESTGTERSFTTKVFMKLGSFWANFVRERQTASVDTPTATIGIKGTTLRVVERDNAARVALTEGLIDVSNARSTVELEPGFRLTEFTRRDDLAAKIEPIPFKVDIRSETRELDFSDNRPVTAYVTLQLIDIESGANVARSGPIYLRSNYDKITYPPEPRLDEQGFARVPLTFAVPEPADGELDGNIYVWALLDRENADDTAEGRVLFRFRMPPTEERLRIEAETGEGERTQ